MVRAKYCSSRYHHKNERNHPQTGKFFFNAYMNFKLFIYILTKLSFFYMPKACHTQLSVYWTYFPRGENQVEKKWKKMNGPNWFHGLKVHIQYMQEGNFSAEI